MTLKAVVENLDDIDESLKSEYQEKDGKFYLDLDDSLKVHTSILPLSNSLVNVKKEKQTLQNKVAELTAKVAELPENFDKLEYDRLVAEEERRKTDPNYKPGGSDPEHTQRMKEQYEQRIRNLETKHTEEKTELENQIKALDGEIVTTTVEDRLTRSLVAAGVGKEFMRAASAMLKSNVKVEKDEETGERKAVVHTDLGEVPVETYVENWSKSDEGKVFVTKPSGSGSKGDGKGGSSEVNPWMAATKNLTAQGQIIQSDRAKAERMMKAAGVPASQIVNVLAG